MANRLESLDESFHSRLKEEVIKCFELAGFTPEQAEESFAKAVQSKPTIDWGRISAVNPSLARETLYPNLTGSRRENPPVVNLYLTDEQKEMVDFVRKEYNIPPNVHASFHEFVDKHPDEIARLSPDEFQLLGLLFKTKGGEKSISLYNQSKP